MKLTVLGCYGPYPPAGAACSGYLLQDGDIAVLLDCGNGVLARLRYFLEPWELSAVVLSHLHSDHISDVMIIRYAMMVHNMHYGGKALTVYAPENPQGEFERLAYKSYVETKPINEKTEMTIGKLHFSFTPGVHPVPSFLTTVTADGAKFVYSGDSEYSPDLTAAAAGADLFLCEAGLLREDIEKGHHNHLAAFQAAQIAADAKVKRLVLTHHHPERDPKLALLEAQEIFADTEIAAAGSLYYL